jgi:hypothetical protein
MSAEIKNYHGTPTLFLDGKPVFDGLMWGSAPTPEGYALKECARLYGEAGVHLFAFDMGTGGSPPDWCGPRPGKEGMYDFSTLEMRFRQVIAADPEARFHLRVHLEMPEWWQKLHPEECEIASDGARLGQSFASRLWRKEAKEFLQALAAYIQSVGLSDRIIAYQTGAGHTGEWVKATTAMRLVCGDYSQPMREHFRAWLRNYYRGELSALRIAWAAPYITFETAEVPAGEAQFNTTQYTFRDPKKEQAVADYLRCLGELCADLIIDFCGTVKEAAGPQTLAGAFYGYLMELAWNAGFFGEGVDSVYSTYQRGGHLGLGKVMQSPNVDFLVSPYSYGFRGIGGEGPSMLPAESVRIHNKLYVFEEDSRTHLSWNAGTTFGKVDTLEESIAVLERNFAYVVTHGQGMWWLAGGGPSSGHVELSQQPAFRTLIKRFKDIGDRACELDRAPSSEIAVLLDDESFYYEWFRNDLDIPLIFQQRLWGLPRMGAPFDTYLLDDFVEGRLKPYKLYIFLNAFHLDAARREKLKSQLRREGRTALWIYASGYLNKDASPAFGVEQMADLTGFGFAKGDHPWGPMMNLLDFDHPITRNLPQDLFWGTNSLLAPIFHIADGGARILGNVVYSEGRCRGGLGVKEFAEWKSVYSAVPNLPSAVLRGVARYAGVHLYSEAGDILYATPELLGVHTAGGGEREFILPGKVEQVVELFSGQAVAQECDRFTVKLKPASTVLYYMGKKNSDW